MKVGKDAFFVCDKCEKLIKKGEGYYRIQYCEAGAFLMGDKKERHDPIHFCKKCYKENLTVG